MNKLVQAGDVVDDIRRIIQSINHSEAILAFSACGTEVTDGGGGGGGAGTVTSVAGGIGITNTPEPIVGAGTVDLDVNSLTTETVLATGDLLPFVDVSVGVTPASQRKITAGNLLAGLQTLGGLVDGVGAAPRVAFWADANTLTSDAAFLYSAAIASLRISRNILSLGDGSTLDLLGAGAVGLPRTLTGKRLGGVTFSGQDSSGLSIVGAAEVRGTAAEDFATSTLGSIVDILTTLIGTGTPTIAVRVSDDGSVLIGTTTKVAGSRLRVLGGDIETDNQLVSTIATGTAPLVVASTTLVTNLNADLLDGLSAAAFQPVDADLTEIAAVANVRGDLLVTNAGPTWVRLAIGGANTFLHSDATDAAWAAIALADLPALTSAQWATKITDETGGPTGGIVFGDFPTLTNATLTLPLIGNFTNATHNHQGLSGGGQLDHGLAMVAASLLDDDHTPYTLRAGRSGTTNDTTLSTSASGTLSGSNQASTVAAPRDLNLDGSSNAAKGQINLLSPAVTRSVTRTPSGTISTLTTAVVGASTLFQDELSIGDTITAGGHTRHVATITNQISLSVDRPWPTDLSAGTTFTYQRPIHKFLDSSGAVRGFLTPDDYLLIGATAINATNQANLSITGTQPASVAVGQGAEAPRVFFAQGAKGGNSTETGGLSAGAGGRFNLVAGAGGDHSGTSGTGGVGGSWTASSGAGGGVSAGDGTGPAGTGGNILFSAGVGGPVTGTSTGTTAGAGGGVTFTAGGGGTAIAGNTRGNGGNLILRPGLAGTGAGTGGIDGSVQLANLGGNVIVGSSVNNGERLGVAGDFAMRAVNVAVVNGNNDDVAIGSRSFVRLTGPTAAFATRGFANGTDGKLLIVESTVNQAWTVSNDNAGSAAANRIYTGTGGDVVLGAGAGATDKARAVFQYDATLTRWVLLSARDATGPR